MPLISEFPIAGPQGKQGPIGPQGKQGPEGKRGPMGPAGPGTGDMLAMVYDPQGKAIDVYKYTDDAVAGRADLTLSNLSNKQKALRNIGGRPNRNLLDNWYFVGGGSQQGGGQFPINQRGQTSYTATSGAMYGFDRWRMQAETSVTIESDGILIDPGDQKRWILQIHEELYIGKTVTLSALTQYGLITATYTATSDTPFVHDISNNFGETLRIQLASTGRWQSVLYTTNTEKIYAMKLELGPTQTLAYQDEEGSWQLFETPDYGEELAKCQRYLPVIGDTTTSPLRLQSAYVNPTNIFFSVPIPAPMRKGNPTIILPDRATISVNAGGTQDGFSFSAVNHGNCITIVANKDSHGLTSNDFPVLAAQNVLLSREL